MKNKKKITVFSLSFLDCICCGFGAVILLFVIVNARAAVIRNDITQHLRGEADRLEREVKIGQKSLVVLKNTLEKTLADITETQGRSVRIIRQVKEQKEQLANLSKTTLATKEHLNQLKADLKSLEEEAQRLKAGSEEDDERGQNTRKFVGSGDRQYLTGVKVGGKHILIMVDASTSMLGSKIVDIVRRRNASDADKLKSPKWQRAIKTVDWITTQIPARSNVQIYTYNEKAQPLVRGKGSDWLDGSNPEELNQAIDKLKTIIPSGGTSLHAVYLTMHALHPPPDNVYLLADGLPTMGSKPYWKKTISGKERWKMFQKSEKLRPKNIPLNIILFPMEGDPDASQAFWKIAQRSRGSFFCPSKDWP